MQTKFPVGSIVEFRSADGQRRYVGAVVETPHDGGYTPESTERGVWALWHKPNRAPYPGQKLQWAPVTQVRLHPDLEEYRRELVTAMVRQAVK